MIAKIQRRGRVEAMAACARMKWSWLLAVALAACTRPNPAVCCLDKADCDKAGLSEVRACSTGLACVEHECVVPSCSTAGCEADTPLCNTTLDVCEGCRDSSDCSKFMETDVCDRNSGACVECLTRADCDPAKPVCDANTCRTCKLDSDCPSSACGDDGACVAENAVVYMSPVGADNGDCTRTGPCRQFAYAVTRTSVSRPHIVLAPGVYTEGDLQIHPSSTSAVRLYIHGGGATLTEPIGQDSATLSVATSVTLCDVTIFTDSSVGLGAGTDDVLVERVRIHGKRGGLSTGGTAVLRDVSIHDATWAVTPYGSLTMERVVISGSTYGIQTGNSVALHITNTLIYASYERAIDVPNGVGTIVSSTIVDAGGNSTAGSPPAVTCGPAMTIRSSIVWSGRSGLDVPVKNCYIVSSIVGPTAVEGAMNVDPMFVDRANHDYHLAPGSPARDAVDVGPETDFEGDPRPRGARFDIGADEAPP